MPAWLWHVPGFRFPHAPGAGSRTPARLVVVGAALGFGPVALDAAVTLVSNLALLQGTWSPVPYGVYLADASLTGIVAPMGLFLALCGILLYIRSTRPPGRSRAFRASLGGLGMQLAAGLLAGVLTFSLYVLPPEIVTVELLRNIVIVLFLSTVIAAGGLLLGLCGMAALLREAPAPRSRRSRAPVRAPRGKSIYSGAPSAR